MGKRVFAKEVPTDSDRMLPNKAIIGKNAPVVGILKMRVTIITATT
jgi:hypothetical protein